MNNESKDKGEDQGLEGKYVDVFRIGNNAYRFILDFGSFAQEEEKQKYFTRVIMGPDTAKDFAEIFLQSIKEYEIHYGPSSNTD